MPHRRTTRATTVLSAVALLITAIAAIDDSAAVGAEGDLAIAVNAGGTAYAATSGISFAADAPSPDIPGSFSGGRGSAVAGSISQTDDPMLYGTVRSGRDFSFAAAGLQAGDYAIELHLVEPEETAAGARLFDVTAEGTLVLDDYDIFTAAGGTLTAHAETLQATVLDGQLDITFGSVVGRPVVAAIAVTFVAAAPAGLSVSPASVDLGAVPVGASSDGVIAISNNGSTNAEILAAQAGAAAFTVIAPSLPAAVAPGSTVTLTVRFSPSIAGAASTELILDTDDTATPTLAVSLFGTGVVDGQPPDIDVSPVALDFGASPLGIPLSQDVTVLNVGSSDLTVTGASATGSPFAASAPLPATVTPNSDSVVTVTFTPLQAGVVTGELVLLSDDPDQPELVVPLTGASSAYAAGSVAVIGCSNTDQHIMGYLNASISDQLAPSLILAAAHSTYGPRGRLPTGPSTSSTGPSRVTPQPGFRSACVRVMWPTTTRRNSPPSSTKSSLGTDRSRSSSRPSTPMWRATSAPPPELMARRLPQSWRTGPSRASGSSGDRIRAPSGPRSYAGTDAT